MMEKIREKKITIVAENFSIDVRFVLMREDGRYAIMAESETEIAFENCYELNWECVNNLFDVLIEYEVTPVSLKYIIEDKRKEEFLDHIE